MFPPLNPLPNVFPLKGSISDHRKVALPESKSGHRVFHGHVHWSASDCCAACWGCAGSELVARRLRGSGRVGAWSRLRTGCRGGLRMAGRVSLGVGGSCSFCGEIFSARIGFSCSLLIWHGLFRRSVWLAGRVDRIVERFQSLIIIF